VEEAAKTAKQSAESVSKGGEKLGRTAAFKAISQVSQAWSRQTRWWQGGASSHSSAHQPAAFLAGSGVCEEGD
jgi:hypothetical protein